MITRFLMGVAVCVGLLALPSGASADLVVNGGFETGTFAGWTQFGDTSFTGVDSGVPVHSGNFAAFFGPVNAIGGIFQNLPTVAGQTYTLDFWLSHPFTDPGQGVEWLVSVGGTTLLDSHDTPNFDYREFTFTFTATSAATDLRFGFLEPPAFFYLDDVSVNEAIPEPGSIALVSMA